MSRHLRRDSLPVLSSNNCICHPARNIYFSVMRWLNDDLALKCLLIAHSGPEDQWVGSFRAKSRH